MPMALLRTTPLAGSSRCLTPAGSSIASCAGLVACVPRWRASMWPSMASGCGARMAARVARFIWCRRGAARSLLRWAKCARLTRATRSPPSRSCCKRWTFEAAPSPSMPWDAMGCQHDIAEQIVRRGADYVLNVKGNQRNLAEAIQTWFDAADAGTLERPFWQHSQTDKNHGRIETRRCVATNDVA